MIRNRGGGGGARGRGARQGQGLLGQAPMQHAAMDTMSTGMKRMLGASSGGGLLGNTPMEGRGHMLQQQPRGLLEQPLMRGGVQEEPDQWGHREDHGYRDNQSRGLLDDPGYGGESEWRDSGDYGQDYQEDYVERRSDHGGLLDHRDNFDPPARHGSIDHRNDDRDLDYRYDDRQDSNRGLMERARLMQGGQQRRDGLLEEPRGLLDSPDMRRGMLDEPDMRRGLLDEPRNLLHGSRGMLDVQDRRDFMDDMALGGRNVLMGRGDGLLDAPDQTPWQQPVVRQGWPDRVNRQQDILEKADLQIKMLQEEKMKEEATRMIKMEEERQKQRNMMRGQRGRGRDGLLGSGPKPIIPSIFDLFEGPRKLLGKRTAEAGRTGGRTDNKRPRHGQTDRRGQQDRKKGARDSRDKDSRSSRDRAGPRKSRFDVPKDSKSPSQSRNNSSDSKKSSGSHLKPKPSTETSRSKKDEKSGEGSKVVAKAVAKETESKSEVILVEYDPEEPTEDVEMTEKSPEKVSATEETGEKREEGVKDEGGEKDEDDSKPKEISLTVTVNKKGRSVNDADKKADEEVKKEKKYKCNVCNVECFDEESFFRHMNGVKHIKKMGIVMSAAPQTVAMMTSRKQAEEHLRKIEAGRRAQAGGKALPVGKALESLCKTCNTKFTGAYKDHKESAKHKERENRRKAGCKSCNVATFNTFADYAKHLQSAWHKKKAKLASWPECKICDQKFKSPRKFVHHCRTDHHIQNKRKRRDDDSDTEDMDVLVTLDTVGFEDDSVGTELGSSSDHENDEESMKVESSPVSKLRQKSGSMSTSTPVSRMKNIKMEAITPIQGEEPAEALPECLADLPDKYDPTVAVGKTFVVSVTGFFCKLCHKFYNNETSAKIAHCQSEPHFDKYKKAMIARLVENHQKSKPDADTSLAANTSVEAETSVAADAPVTADSTVTADSSTAQPASNGSDMETNKSPEESTPQDPEGPQNGSSKPEDEASSTETEPQGDDSAIYKTANESQLDVSTKDGEEEEGDADDDVAIEAEEPKSRPVQRARRGAAKGAAGAVRGPRARRGRKV